jgi:hypothetical protein
VQCGELIFQGARKLLDPHLWYLVWKHVEDAGVSALAIGAGLFSLALAYHIVLWYAPC